MVKLHKGVSLLIDETNQYIKENFNKQRTHIDSGSDQDELRHLNNQLKIDRYFTSIYGSLTAKSELVEQVIAENKYVRSDCVLIGDSISNMEAPKNNDIDFTGCNYSESR
jgi:phosphoglycolate phosphatase-like HAD superfamily hydrolase